MPPILNKAGQCTQLDIAEMTVCDFQGWIIKDIVASAMLSWTACSGEVSSRDMGTLMQLMERPLWGETESSCQQPA